VPTRPVQRAVIATAILLLTLGHSWFFRHHITDDAFIGFRYLENLLEGHGLVYNPGERVWGYTNFLWVALLYPWVAAGLEPLRGAHLLGVLSNTLVLALVLVGLPGSGKAARDWNLGGAALLASSGAFLLQGLSGLETSFFTLLVLVMLTLYLRANTRSGWWRLPAAGLAAALATLTRPEGLFLFGLLVFDALVECRSTRRGTRDALAGLLAGFVPLVLAYELCVWHYYAALWPNSIDAKVGLSIEQLRRGLHYAAVFATRYPAHALILIGAGLRWRHTGPNERCLLRFALFLALFPVAVGGDWMLGYRLFHTPMALSGALVPFVLAAFAGRAGSAHRARTAAIVLVALCCAISASSSLLDPHVNVAARRTLVHAAIRAGKWMRENLPGDATLATNTGGSIPYYSRLRIIDMMGINNRTIAQRRDLPEAWMGIEKGNGRYVLSRRPDYIQLGSFLGSPVPLFLSDIEIFASEEFHRNYELVTIALDAETKLRIYRRLQREKGPLGSEERRRIRRIVEKQMELSRFRY
jgi:arabinofuranosyltransferase